MPASNGEDTRAIANLLLAMEAELRRTHLWTESPPNAEALASRVPFCYDTMSFDRWLQWVFLVRMRGIIELGLSLPEHCAIAPLAEECLIKCGPDVSALLALIRRFDELIENPGCGAVPPGPHSTKH